MLKKLLSFLTIITAATIAAQATIADAENYMDSYRRLSSGGSPGSSAYLSLYKAFEAYRDAISATAHGTDEYRACKNALREIFPLLSDGAYHFAAINDQDKVLRFACAYVDLSLLPSMADENLQNYDGYPILANLAATNIYNRGDYVSATSYFQAYLNTADTESREMAFEGLARCFYEQRDYDRAAYIATQGITYYPRNWNMLIIGIESCGKTGNDAKMEPMLRSALSMSPGHKGLLEYQGKMYERTKRYAEAANTFDELYRSTPTSLDYACHLGFNLYNAGTVNYQRSLAPGVSKDDRKTALESAKRYYNQASPVLRDVLDNNPYATNVAHALAMCYSVTNDGQRLQEANATLTALRSGTVAKNDIPSLDLSYRPTVDLTPPETKTAIGDTPHSDVDINIPETGLRNEKTYVVIIGNENYKHHSKVNYAQNDGRIFAEYCNKVLGVPKDNIRQYYDATLSEIREPIKYLTEKTAMNPGELNVIFYYAGHGVPDVANNSAYLLPTDATGTDFESCYGLDRLYRQFDDMKARNVTVFLDACFSGATRSNEMLFAERFVEYEVEDLVARGNTVVFSATTGKQTAMGYDDQQHGFFTYYLLKALQESRGEITLSELARRLRKDVDNKAYDKKNKHQTPTVNVSPSLGESWKTRTLLH